MPPDSTHTGSVVPAKIQARDRAASTAGLSLLIPGLAQWLQQRWVDGFIHLGAVSTYLIIVRENGWGQAGWLALAWNLWSVVDAYRHERRQVYAPQPDQEPNPTAAPGSLVS